jgi:hypothetical protein
MRRCGCLIAALVGLFLGLYIAGSHSPRPPADTQPAQEVMPPLPGLPPRPTPSSTTAQGGSTMADTHVTLTDEPDLRFTPNGTEVANFRLAVTARIKDGDTWRDGETSFFRVNVWRQLAEHVAESLAKGDRAVVIGRLKSRSWETPEGDKRSMVEVEADEVAPSLVLGMRVNWSFSLNW